LATYYETIKFDDFVKSRILGILHDVTY
jgi:hypothetical protein